MSLSSAPSAPSSLSDSSSSQSDTLLQNEIVEEHPKDTLQYLADTLPHSADALPHSADSPSLHEDTRSTMPPWNRSRRRNVHIFDARDRSTSIGGLVLTAGVTNTNLYAMIEIFVIFGGENILQDGSSNAIEGEYILRNESNIAIEKDDSMLLPGNYYIDSPYRGGTVNSVQNGLLLESAIHQGFDMYMFSINPDDNYKIICFSRDRKGIAGKYIDRRLLDDPQRPADQLLRWHFRQAVLTNMKGAGEPVFEHDFPPGSDIVGGILKGPKAAKRMEFELFSRMATQFDLTE
ncbi:hypothetical protein EG329_009178 [Mollisiaceae sp. DMI_Dod_QoI]|nr:hypothetical protein EG329_009178 [Helotiales sp. DMI_Dod_QoI]